MRSTVTLSHDALERAASLLDDRFRPIAVLLYGSHAAGQARSESDVDLGIVSGGDGVDAFEVAAAKTELEAGYLRGLYLSDLPIDIGEGSELR